MRDNHWTDDELISKLFDVGPQDGHLKSCPECARRWAAVQQKYESRRIAIAEVSESTLAAQRLAVRRRLEVRPWYVRPVLASSLAAALLLAVISLILIKPNPSEQPAPDVISEDKMLEEIYQMSLSSEPVAIEPVQSLFEE
jgi:hypothetical protein